MNKFVILSIAAVALLSSCHNKQDQQEIEEQRALQEATKEQLQNAVTDRDQLLSLVNDISAGMDQIKRLENILAVSNSAGGDVSSQREQIKADIAAIQETLEQRREQLAKLEERLKKSNLNNQALQKTIATLRSQIDSQSAEIETLRTNLADANARIGSLNTQVDSLNTTVANVTDERNVARQESTDLANELNTCYYVVGSKTELTQHKILESGFLRKTKLMKGEFDQSFFIKADKRHITTIALHSKKAEVLTSQPASSYQIIEQNGQKVLQITDAAKFWELSNYLVVKID
jgi:chromosome segregation ATPase